MRKCAWLWLILCFALTLGGCAGETRTEIPETTTATQAPTEDPNLKVEAYALAVNSEADLQILEQFPNLKEADLQGSTCYEAVASYIQTHPQVAVSYDVRIGNEVYVPEIEELALPDGTYPYEELLNNLQYLPNVKRIILPQTMLSGPELAQLRSRYPEIAVEYTVLLGDMELNWDVQQLDLSHLKAEFLDDICRVLAQLPQLQDVQLMRADRTSRFSIADVKAMMSAAPEKTIHYTFKLFGKNVSTTDERIEFVKKKIGNKGVAQVREALQIMPRCSYVLLDNCGINNETMAQLRDDHPDVKIVWRVSVGNKSYLTDTTVVRCIDTLENKNTRNLKYCTDVVYMDIGHNYVLSDLSFVSYMPNLKVAIVSDCHTDSVEPFAACKNLQYLEIVNCDYLNDVSALANCKELRGVNISSSMGVDDLSPFYGLDKLERLFLGKHDLPQEEIDAVRAALPNCWVTDKSEAVAWVGFNYSVGWRLDDETTLAQWYVDIMDIFGYTRTM